MWWDLAIFQGADSPHSNRLVGLAGMWLLPLIRARCMLAAQWAGTTTVGTSCRPTLASPRKPQAQATASSWTPPRPSTRRPPPLPHTASTMLWEVQSLNLDTLPQSPPCQSMQRRRANPATASSRVWASEPIYLRRKPLVNAGLCTTHGVELAIFYTVFLVQVAQLALDTNGASMCPW
jgi:hypothetical protein